MSSRSRRRRAQHRRAFAEAPAVATTASPAPETVELGFSGSRRFRGIVMDEYNADLRGPRGIDVFDRMRSSDGQVQAMLEALTLPLHTARWRVEGDEDDKLSVQAAEILEQDLLHGMTAPWSNLLHHILLALPYGFVPFEKVWEVRDGRVCLRKLAPRHPRTHYEWEFTEDGGLAGWWQAGTDGTGQYRKVLLPIEKLLIATWNEEFENPEGRSILRAAYKHWFYKDHIYELVGIGCERNIAGIPVCNLPANASPDDKQTALDIGKKIKTAEAGSIVEPNGYAWRWMESGRSVADALPIIEHHDIQMARSVLAQFLNLGATRYGSQALSSDQRQLFFLALNAFADWICDLFNLYVIPQLCAFNWPKLKILPKLAHSDMSVLMNPEGLGAVIQMLSQGGGLAPDHPFLEWVRDTFGFPDADPATAIDRSPSVSAGLRGGVTAAEPAGCVHRFEEDEPAVAYRFAAGMDLPEVRRRLSGMKSAGDRALGEVLSSQLSDLQTRIAAVLEGEGDQARKYAALSAVSVPGMSRYREELHSLMVSAAEAGMQAAARQSGGEAASFTEEFHALVTAEVDAIARRYQEQVRFSVVKPVLDDLSRGLDVKTVLWNLAQNCKRAVSTGSAESVSLGMEHAGAVVNTALAAAT